MSGATTFRSQCKLCNDIFFVPFKDALYCPRCAKRIGYRYPRPPAPERTYTPPAATRPSEAPSPASAVQTGSSEISSREVGPKEAASSLRDAPLSPASEPGAAATTGRVAPPSESSSSVSLDASSRAEAPAEYLRASPPPRPVVSPEAPARAGIAEPGRAPGASAPRRTDSGIAGRRGPGGDRGSDRGDGRAGGRANNRPGTGGRERAGGRYGDPPRGSGKDPAAAAEPAAPAAPVKITESLRRSIEHAYEYHADEPEITLKEIIDRICLEFGLDRRTVHEVASQAHTAHLRKQVHEATTQQRDNIARQYEHMVFQGLRPEEGRRRMIARQVGLPLAAVTSAINHWSWRHTDPRQLSRQDKFRIEQAFWNLSHNLAEGEETPAFDELVRRVADLVNLPLFGVARWIDQLHDDPRLHLHVPPAPADTAAALEEAYRTYLAAPEPPPDSLHRTLAEKYGCTIRQAHRTLLLYRWRERLRTLQARPDQQAMVEMSVLAPEAGAGAAADSPQGAGPSADDSAAKSTRRPKSAARQRAAGSSAELVPEAVTA